MANLRYFSFIFLLLTVWACDKDETSPSFTYQVAMQYRPHVQTFIMEAEKRGIQIDTTNLIMEGVETLPDSICGLCNHTSSQSDRQKVVQFNTSQHCAESLMELEALVLHELGHCFLGRLHDDTLLPNGDPKSIMKTGGRKMYAPCTYQFGNEPCDNTFKRAYYLDELFDPATPVPDWAQ